MAAYERASTLYDKQAEAWQTTLDQDHLQIYKQAAARLEKIFKDPQHLRPRGGRKLALQNGKVEGSEVGKNTALFLEAGVKSPLYVALCPDPPAREEREERRKDERQRGERERGERDERDEKEMREMREMRETVRQ